MVRLKAGENNSATLGRFSVPAAFRCAQTGDSGINGRMRMSGMAGITPESSVYRQVAWPSATVPSVPARNSGICKAGSCDSVVV